MKKKLENPEIDKQIVHGETMQIFIKFRDRFLSSKAFNVVFWFL